MPLFTKAEMDLHVSKSGKNIDQSKQSHTVPTSMRKAKTFLEDEYLKDVVAASDSEYFFFQCLFHHSLKKKCQLHQFQNFDLNNSMRKIVIVAVVIMS